MRSLFRNLPALLLFTSAFQPFALAQEADDLTPRQMFIKAYETEGDEQLEWISRIGLSGATELEPLLEAWILGAVYTYPLEAEEGEEVTYFTLAPEETEGEPQKAIRVIDGEPLLGEDGEPLAFTTTELGYGYTSRGLRRDIRRTTDMLALNSPDKSIRMEAILKLGLKQSSDYLPTLKEFAAQEKSPKVKKVFDEAIAISELKLGSHEEKLAAIETLADVNSLSGIHQLKNLRINIDKGYTAETWSEEDIATLDASILSIEQYMERIEFFATAFRGLSLGAVLLVVALGLAITFGLMGVINMAHGEMIAIGAYATYLVQNLFLWMFTDSGLALEYYFIFAIPVAFVVAAVMGMGLEISVIRFLYKRPLESLLATWGVSWILQQTFRLVFGSANRQVDSPTWLVGTLDISDVAMGYNRLFVIGFAAVILLGTWLLMTKTNYGLCMRAVMQNPAMAAAMGVNTARIRMLTFAFGSGLAGLAGAFLSQIGSVGASLGQSYIIDSFMVVVVGGVGNLAGTLVSALGIGVFDQTLQPIWGPVMGKICVLVAIIIFLQWKPGGLFPSKSRNLEG